MLKVVLYTFLLKLMPSNIKNFTADLISLKIVYYKAMSVIS